MGHRCLVSLVSGARRFWYVQAGALLGLWREGCALVAGFVLGLDVLTCEVGYRQYNLYMCIGPGEFERSGHDLW